MPKRWWISTPMWLPVHISSEPPTTIDTDIDRSDSAWLSRSLSWEDYVYEEILVWSWMEICRILASSSAIVLFFLRQLRLDTMAIHFVFRGIQYTSVAGLPALQPTSTLGPMTGFRDNTEKTE